MRYDDHLSGVRGGKGSGNVSDIIEVVRTSVFCRWGQRLYSSPGPRQMGFGETECPYVMEQASQRFQKIT